MERHVNVAAVIVWERFHAHGVKLRHEGQGEEDDGDNVQDEQGDGVATAVLRDLARVVCFEDVGLFFCALSVRKYDEQCVWTGCGTDVLSRTSCLAICRFARQFRPFLRL